MSKPQKWMFVHDHRFVQTDDFVGSHAQFEAALWSRYLAFCDQLTVVGREGPRQDPDTLYVSSRAAVDFLLLPDHGRSVKRVLRAAETRKTIAAAVAEHDVIVARIPSVLGFQAIEEAKRQGKVCAIEAVGCPWDALWNYGSIPGRLYAVVQYRQMRLALADADHVIYVTERFLQNRYPTNAANVANASNVELVPAADAKEALDPAVLNTRLARIAQFAPDHSFRVGLIGTLIGRTKGIQHALQAIRALQCEFPKLTLHILGGGDSRPWNAEAADLGIKHMVSFDGTLSGGQPVLKWLDAADIYIQPSLQEGLPRALIEAMSRAAPAVGSDRAGIPELLHSQDIVAAAAPMELASQIRAIANDKLRMAEAAKRNFAKAHEYVARKLHARRSQFFEKVLSDSHRAHNV
ncbi:Protein CapJ [Alteripontixanthobacter maritimus]|uniref:Protein CapJ n=1 Tax=Alteripontixanthobacter maritimus TaxID=2161824 RepID=A0A369QAN0_9SPHN|nr:glycosyltransferase family 4 protein [Alteripontixanthobacter maritimus]RDC61390.1 Protein CapJ [Alteripontixanthobacter maritimus]